jgi:hypothetical protein
MVSGEGGQRLQAFAACGCAPGGLFVKERVRFCKQIARRFGHPETEFIVERQGVIRAVGDEQDRLVEVRVQAGQHRQARRTRQAKRLRG